MISGVVANIGIGAEFDTSRCVNVCKFIGVYIRLRIVSLETVVGAVSDFG
jgi:hypothetical protein